MNTYTVIPTTGNPFDIEIDWYEITIQGIILHSYKTDNVGVLPLTFGFIKKSIIQYPA